MQKRIATCRRRSPTPIIVLHKVRGHQITSPTNALAEAYLRDADQMKGVRKTTALKKARRACDAAVTQGSIVRGGCLTHKGSGRMTE